MLASDGTAPSLALRACVNAPRVEYSLWHWRRLWFPRPAPYASPFLHPLAPPALPGFHATRGALTLAGTGGTGVASALSCLLTAPTRTAGPVGWVWPDPVPLAPRRPVPCPAGLPCSRQRIVRPFRLQPPAALPGTVGLGCFPPGLPRPAVFTVGGIPAWDKNVTRASPFPRRLARTAGRIEFACATDGTFTWGCSPPPLPRTQLPSVTGSQTDPDKDFHLAGSLRSKAHECGGRRRFGLWPFFPWSGQSKQERKKAAATAALQRKKATSPKLRAAPGDVHPAPLWRQDVTNRFTGASLVLPPPLLAGSAQPPKPPKAPHRNKDEALELFAAEFIALTPARTNSSTPTGRPQPATLARAGGSGRTLARVCDRIPGPERPLPPQPLQQPDTVRLPGMTGPTVQAQPQLRPADATSRGPPSSGSWRSQLARPVFDPCRLARQVKQFGKLA